MNVSRVIVGAVLVTASGCAPRSNDTAPRPLIPREGPSASVRVQYDGGLFHRQANAVFRVEQPAYVMVAHLGGDGVIRVLFPEDGRSMGYVPARRYFRTASFRGDYDANPSYWFLRPVMLRSTSARQYSYDGQGHGFVFMIASNRPLRFERVSELGFWDDLEVRAYQNTLDPRQSIRQFADYVAGGAKYTLDYATSSGSYALHSYAQAMADCAMLSYGSFAMAPWYFLGTGSYLSSLYGMHGVQGCSGRSGPRATLASYTVVVPQRSGRGALTSTTQVLPPVDIPAHRIPRAGRRDQPEATPARTLDRPTFGHFGGPTRHVDRRERAPERRQPSSSSGTSSATATAPASGSGSSSGASAPARPVGRENNERQTTKPNP